MPGRQGDDRDTRLVSADHYGMAGCYSIVSRRLRRYCCCKKNRFILLLLGLACMGVTAWSFGADNRTLHSALLSLKRHGEHIKTSAQLKYRFLDRKQDASGKLLHNDDGNNRFTNPKHHPLVQGQLHEARQPEMPNVNHFEHQPNAVPDLDKPNWAPALPQMQNEQLLDHRQPHAGPDQRDFNGAPQPAMPQAQNSNTGQPNAASNIGQANGVPEIALPQGQNTNMGQPNGAPQLALPQGQNNNMDQPNGAPQLALPQGQNNNMDQPNGAPQLGLPQGQKNNMGQPNGAPQLALPQGQNNNMGQPNGAPQLALPQGQNNNMGQPNGAPQLGLPQGQNNNMGQPNGAPQLAMPQGQNNNMGQPNGAPQLGLPQGQNNNMGQPNGAPQLALPQGQNNNMDQPNGAPQLALPQGQNNNMGQPNGAPQLALPQGQNNNMDQPNGAPQLALPQGQNNNMGQPNGAPQLALPQGQNNNMDQPNGAPQLALPQGQNNNMDQPNGAPQLGLPQGQNNNMGQPNGVPQPALPQGQNNNLDQPNGVPQPALPQGQNNNMGQPNGVPQPALPQGQNNNMGQPNGVPQPALPQEQNNNMGQPNGVPQPALPQGQNNNMGQPNRAPEVAMPQGQNSNHAQPNAAPNSRSGVREDGDDELPVILSWHNVGGPQNMPITCGPRKCLSVVDHDEWKKHDYMAITFYGTDFGAGGLPIPRKPGHLWSVIHEESPKNNDWLFSDKSIMSVFNLTATFKRQSHYSMPTMWLRDERDLTDTKFMMSIAEKNRLRRDGLAPVVFVHMDCHTASDRSHYMRLLQQYIKIDSYSNCEHNKNFPSKNLSFTNGMAPMMSDDFFQFLAQYKFTFAIENAVCDDYITEKFWRPLRLGIVPIVFGSSKIKDMAPSNQSIIDIRDYKSVKEVADLITSLDNNDAEYLKYLSFKQTGVTNPVLKEELRKRDWGVGKTYNNHFSGFNCFVCDKLHEMKNQVRNGQPVTQWSGKFDHYGCPAPKEFDDQGRYIVENKRWLEPLSYAEFYAQSLRYHIDNNINANIREIHNYASKLLKKAQSGIRVPV